MLKALGGNFGKMIVLLVSECLTSLFIQRAIFKSFNVEAVTVSEGEEAIDLFKLGMKFDLVMIDKYMCSIDGVQLTTILRDMGVTDLIVGLVDDAIPSDKELFLDSGADLVFDKPLNAEKAALIIEAVENK